MRGMLLADRKIYGRCFPAHDFRHNKMRVEVCDCGAGMGWFAEAYSNAAALDAEFFYCPVEKIDE